MIGPGFLFGCLLKLVGAWSVSVLAMRDESQRRWLRALSADVASGLVISVPYQRGMLAPPVFADVKGCTGLHCGAIPKASVCRCPC